jgi:hypothetical protein
MRQERIVIGLFARGALAGGAMTCHILRNQTNPAALDEETQSKLNALPFRAAVPGHLPVGSVGPVIALEANAAGAVQALLVYRTPQGCFGLLEAVRGLSVVAGPDAGAFPTRSLGSGSLLTQPEVGSTAVGTGSTVHVALVGPSRLGAMGCPMPLGVDEAKTIMESLLVIAPPPPPLEPLR